MFLQSFQDQQHLFHYIECVYGVGCYFVSGTLSVLRIQPSLLSCAHCIRTSQLTVLTTGENEVFCSFFFKLFISGIFSQFTAAIKGFQLYFCRYHLQALRHLAVLAAEPRLLVPVDVDNLKPCYALLEVTYKVNWGKVAFQNSVKMCIPKQSYLQHANIYLVHQVILSVLNTRRQALLWDPNTGNTVHQIHTNIIYPVAFGSLLIILIL